MDDSKIAKLKDATDKAKEEMDQKHREVKDSQERLDVAKELLQSLEPEEQLKIKMSDTKLPELIAMHQLAQDAYETAVKRYETNQKYLDKFTGAATAGTASTAEGSSSGASKETSN